MICTCVYIYVYVYVYVVYVYVYVYVCTYAHMHVYVPYPRACCLPEFRGSHLQEGKTAPTNRRISRASLRAEAGGGLK